MTPGIVAAGNVTTEKTYTGASGLSSGTLSKTKTSSYEGTQLSQVTQPGGISYYHYDVAGNLDCVTSSDSPADCSPSGSSGSSSLLADYSYDFSERLLAYRSYSGGAIEDESDYTYDALDRVVIQSESHEDADADRTTSFSHIGLTPMVATEVADYDSGSEVSKHLSYDAYGTRLAMTNVASTERTYTFGYDVHGSTSVVLENTPGANEGTVRASYGYRPYGAEDTGLTKGDTVTDSSGVTTNSDPFNPYRYTAKRYDSGSESLDMGARRFSTGTASFIQPDLYMGALANLGLSTDRLTGNRYALAAGNPVSYIESDGHVVYPDGDATAESAKTYGRDTKERRIADFERAQASLADPSFKEIDEASVTKFESSIIPFEFRGREIAENLHLSGIGLGGKLLPGGKSIFVKQLDALFQARFDRRGDVIGYNIFVNVIYNPNSVTDTSSRKGFGAVLGQDIPLSGQACGTEACVPLRDSQAPPDELTIRASTPIDEYQAAYCADQDSQECQSGHFMVASASTGVGTPTRVDIAALIGRPRHSSPSRVIQASLFP